MGKQNTEQLKRAIRAFTVDVDDGDAPNGPAEAALQALCDRLLALTLPPGVAVLVADWLELEADRTQELREAAEAYFGEDFHSEVAHG